MIIALSTTVRTHFQILFVEIMRLLLVITSIRARKIGLIRKFASNNNTIYTTFDFSAFIFLWAMPDANKD